MHVSNSALRAELGSCLEQLQDSLARLAAHIQLRARDAWVWQAPVDDANPFATPPPDLSPELTRETIARAIQAIKYEEGQPSHESRIAPGLVVVSEEGLGLADEVNRHKNTLAGVLRAMRGRTEVGIVDQRTGERGPRPLREVALEAFYFRRLHHYQAIRKIEVLRETPEYIGFIWATSRDVRQSSPEKLIRLGKTPNDYTLSTQDVEALATLPADEPLAIVRPGNATPSANIRWARQPGLAPIKRLRPAVLPLMMLGHRRPAKLRKLPGAPTPEHYRLTRDPETESKPFLESASVYRYLPHLREQKRLERAEHSSRDDAA
jgi:hypothetical protein